MGDHENAKVRKHEIEVIVQAYRRNRLHRERIHLALAKVRELCPELDLVTRRSKQLWKRLGIWPRSRAERESS